MKQPTNQAEKRNFQVISFPESEKTKQEIRLENPAIMAIWDSKYNLVVQKV